MKTGARVVALRYAVVVLSVAIALVLTLLLPWLKHRETFILFFGAVAFSAWYGGRGPGWVSCVLAAILQNYLIAEPVMAFSLHPEALIPSLFFLVVALAISELTTRLVNARELALEQRQWLEVTLSSIGDAVIATDSAGKVVVMNPAAESITGWDAQAARNTHCGTILQVAEQDGASRSPNTIENVLRAGELEHAAPGTMLELRDGRKVIIEGNAAPIKDSTGQVRGVIFVFRDVTQREELGRKLLEYQNRLRAAAAEVSLAEERERRRIAEGLHDRVGLSMGLSRIKLGTLRTQISDVELVRQFDEITQLMKQIIAEIRTLTFELSPPILYEFGLAAALEWLAGNMRAQHQLECEFNANGDTGSMKQEVQVMLYQAARELLANVVKHARARRATMLLSSEKGSVRLMVEDDGGGFDASSVMLAPEKILGFGLFSMQERISLLGGTFAVESGGGSGTRVTLTLPKTA